MIRVKGANEKAIAETNVAVKRASEESLTSTEPSVGDSDDSAGDVRNNKTPLSDDGSQKANEDSSSLPPDLVDLSFSVEEKEEEQPPHDESPSTTKEKNNATDQLDDEFSQASELTLLSDLSSIEEKHELDRLYDDFSVRDTLMKKLVASKSTEHVRIIQEYEESMRKALHEHYETLLVQESTRQSQQRQNKSQKPTFFQKLYQDHLVIETARGVASIVLFSVAYLSCWEITTAVIYELTKNCSNESWVHFIIMFVGVIMLRLSGGIYGWLDSDSYKDAQTALQRLYATRYGRLLQWFRRHPNVKAFVDLLAFYMCWIAVSFFQYRALQLLDKRESIAQGLPSFHHNDVSTLVKDKLVYGIEYETEALELEAQDSAFLLEQVSITSYTALMGDDFAPLVGTRALLAFWAVAAVFSISILRFALGQSFEI